MVRDQVTNIFAQSWPPSRLGMKVECRQYRKSEPAEALRFCSFCTLTLGWLDASAFKEHIVLWGNWTQIPVVKMPFFESAVTEVCMVCCGSRPRGSKTVLGIKVWKSWMAPFLSDTLKKNYNNSYHLLIARPCSKFVFCFKSLQQPYKLDAIIFIL